MVSSTIKSSADDLRVMITPKPQASDTAGDAQSKHGLPVRPASAPVPFPIPYLLTDTARHNVPENLRYIPPSSASGIQPLGSASRYHPQTPFLSALVDSYNPAIKSKASIPLDPQLPFRPLIGSSTPTTLPTPQSTTRSIAGPSRPSPSSYLVYPHLSIEEFDLKPHFIDPALTATWHPPIIYFASSTLPPLPPIQDAKLRERVRTSKAAANALYGNTRRDVESECYEPMEFIGDKILGMGAMRGVIKDPWVSTAGMMSHLTSILTQNDTLAYLSLTYRLHYGYKDTPGRFQTQKDLADLFEAYIGGAWIDAKTRGEENSIGVWLETLFSKENWPDWRDRSGIWRDNQSILAWRRDMRIVAKEKYRNEAIQRGNISGMVLSDKRHGNKGLKKKSGRHVADERLAVARAMSRADIRDLKTRRLAARAMAGPPQIPVDAEIFEFDELSDREGYSSEGYSDIVAMSPPRKRIAPTEGAELADSESVDDGHSHISTEDFEIVDEPSTSGSSG